MAKTELYGQSPSQQQTSSPRKVKPAVSEPELVAGQEVVGREISVFQGSVKNPEWWDGKVIEFNSNSAQHLIRYHKAHSSEEWLQLSGQPFQWKGSPPSGAAPNPTVKGIKLNDSILGRKVKVFWPTMCKWYLGSIKEYDPHSSRHTIKYKDGEVKDHALRNEAVWWLDVNPDAAVLMHACLARSSHAAQAAPQVAAATDDAASNTAQQQRRPTGHRQTPSLRQYLLHRLTQQGLRHQLNRQRPDPGWGLLQVVMLTGTATLASSLQPVGMLTLMLRMAMPASTHSAKIQQVCILCYLTQVIAVCSQVLTVSALLHLSPSARSGLYAFEWR